MRSGKADEITLLGETGPRHNPHWLTSTLQDELSKESQALLFAMSELLTKHGEQMKMALQTHEDQIIQAMDDKGLSSLSRSSLSRAPLQSEIVKPTGWNEVSVVPLPNCMGENSPPIIAPVEEIQEITLTTSFHLESTDAATQDVEDEQQNPTVKDLLPEYMIEKGNTDAPTLQQMAFKRSCANLDAALGWRVRVKGLLLCKPMEFVVTACIFLNALNIGVQADWAMKNAGEDTPVLMQAANAFFSLVFAIELVLRIFAYRMEFFSRRNREFSWNLFDAFLVISGLVDEALSLLISAPNLTVIRVLRVFRLVRVIRVVRVLRFFRDLRIIVAGIAGAMKSMLWAVGLLFMMMFIVSICLMQLTAFELHSMEQEQRDVLLENYGSLIVSIYTLWMAISGGCDWGDAAQPLLDISPFLALLFSLYIAFSVLCVLNIITGVFVENASNISVADEEQLVVEGFESRVKWFEEVKKLFNNLVGEGGALDSRHFHRFLDDVKVQACFKRLGIDVYDTSKTGLFQLLDFDNTGKVELEEFAVGLQMLHGDAKKIDLARIQWELHKVKKEVMNLCNQMKMEPSTLSGRASTTKRASHTSTMGRTRKSTSDMPNSAWAS